VRLFAAGGVAPRRLSAVGYADNRPVDSNDTAEGRSRNRRVTLLILADPLPEPEIAPAIPDSVAPPQGLARLHVGAR
jgi:chemotaxis protein MotB